MEAFREKIISLVSIETIFLVSRSYNLIMEVSINKLTIKQTMTKKTARVMEKLILLPKTFSSMPFYIHIDLNNNINLP
jgi:hypothetical protein